MKNEKVRFVCPECGRERLVEIDEAAKEIQWCTGEDCDDNDVLMKQVAKVEGELG